MKKILIGCDNSGLLYKNEIIKLLKMNKINFEDVGLVDNEDYPDVAQRLCKKLLDNNCKGILICGTGMGMCLAANKINKIRATLCTNEYSALKSATSNDANVMTIGALTTGIEVVKSMVKIWIENHEISESSKMKLEKINKIERENLL